MIEVQQQRKPCRRFVDVSDEVARRRSTQCRSRRYARWRRMSASPRCILACVQEATCGPASTICTGSSIRLISATPRKPGSRGRATYNPEQYVPRLVELAETVPVWKPKDQYRKLLLDSCDTGLSRLIGCSNTPLYSPRDDSERVLKWKRCR